LITVGLLNPLYNAVAWIIVQFHAMFTPIFGKNSGASWGLSIVCLVVVIRIALIPLFVKQIKSTRNMQALQPRIKEIQQKYKNDRERQSQELMKLYKETGTNPLSSCLPIIAQAPFFFSLYTVLSRIAHDKTTGALTADLVDSASRAKIFGAPISLTFRDASSKAAELGASPTTIHIVTVVMIVLMSLSQFITQRQLMLKNMSPEAMDNPFVKQQKMLMYVFPIMFAVFGINFPVGVLLYWLTTNVWTMGQQLYVIRRMPTPGSLAHKELEKRKAAKGGGPGDAAGGAKPAGGPATTPTGGAPKGGPKSDGSPGGQPAAGGDGSGAADRPTPAASQKRQQPKRQSRSKRSGPSKAKK
jgi:YidC/Oxa1 family membrane protein insertase